MKNILIAAGILCLFAGAGCKKGYLDINNNPNNPAGVIPELVLPSALNSTASRLIVGPGYPAFSTWVGQWAVSGSYAPSTTNFSTYKETTDYGEGVWDNIYNNLEDYYYIATQAAAQEKPFYAGVAKIMMSHEFEQLVDMFGNVPYTNALQGTANLQPTYSNAQDIYEDLIVQIDSGITYLKKSGGAGVLPKTDIMFSGDVTSWIQFANTLKLRILIRQTEISGRDGYIQSHINDIKSEGTGFLTADADVNPDYTNSAGKQNPFYGFNYNTSGTYINDFWRASQFGLDFYEKNKDSIRAHLVYGPTPGDPNVYQGNTLGQTDGHVGSASSIFGPGVVKTVSSSSVVISAAESYFLQSEAVLRGFLSGNAQNLYHSGIQASFDYLGAGDATKYYSQTNNSIVSWDDSKSLDYKLNLIIAQKWGAENSVTPFEAWCDYRRLFRLPFNQSIPLTKSPYFDVLAVPVRILYPTSEYSTNGDNIPDQSAQAHHTDKIFWMP